jgi:Lytic transglycolase
LGGSDLKAEFGMSRVGPRPEHRLVNRIGWLRAVVWGQRRFAGVAGLVAGAVSVTAECYSQAVLRPTLPIIVTLILISVFCFLWLRWFGGYVFRPPVVAAFKRLRLSIALVPVAALAVTPTYAGEQSGVASTFCDAVTATGGMDCNALVAASPGLPFGTMVTVVHNGQSEIVKIIDRGPAVWTHRVIDLSTSAGRGISLDGLGAVSLTWDAEAIIPLPHYVASTVPPLVS